MLLLEYQESGGSVASLALCSPSLLTVSTTYSVPTRNSCTRTCDDEEEEEEGETRAKGGHRMGRGAASAGLTFSHSAETQNACASEGENSAMGYLDVPGTRVVKVAGGRARNVSNCGSG